MALSKRQIALIHVARKRLGMSDGAYRTVLAQLCGKESTTELDQADFDAICGFFEWSGFRPAKAQGPDFGARPGMASFAQLELIRALWHEFAGGAPGLETWLRRCFHVDAERFLTAADARKAITALKAMKARAA
jgi:phage gp16-like protein